MNGYVIILETERYAIATCGRSRAVSRVTFGETVEDTPRSQAYLIATNQIQTREAVAMCGLGGLGKTQRAVELSYRYGRYYPGGVDWMRFADAVSLAQSRD